MATKKNDKQALAEAKAIINKWRGRLFLLEWNINVEVQVASPENDYVCLADCNADPVYLQAHINIYPGWTKKNNAEKEEALVHELAHCLTQEMLNTARAMSEGTLCTRKQILATNERMTQRLANVCILGWRKK